VPSTSKKQHNFMAAIANNPSFAKKVGVSQSVGKDFTAADKGKTFKRGDDMKKSEMGMKKRGMHQMPDGKMMKNSAMNMGGMAGMKKGGMPMKDGKPAFLMGKKMNMGGMAKYASGGSVSARADGIASKGKTKGKMC